MEKPFTKEEVVKGWIIRGIQDFYIFWSIGYEWHDQIFSFLSQGLEKICKAYILGKQAHEYESLEENIAREKMFDITKDLNHDFVKMIKIINNKEVDSFIANYGDDKITGTEILSRLEILFHQSRYPFPPDPKRYYADEKGKIPKSVFTDEELEILFKQQIATKYQCPEIKKRRKELKKYKSKEYVAILERLLLSEEEKHKDWISFKKLKNCTIKKKLANTNLNTEKILEHKAIAEEGYIQWDLLGSTTIEHFCFPLGLRIAKLAVDEFKIKFTNKEINI